MPKQRPELTGNAADYYDEEQAALYTRNAHTQSVQIKLTERALELINAPPPAFLLEIGAGSGISTQFANECGYVVVAVDVSPEMIKLNETDHLICQDVGKGLNFAPG